MSDAPANASDGHAPHAHRPHVCVIGAGAIGGSVAFHLLRHDVRVTVVDAARPGLAASRASYGWINARDRETRSYHRLNRLALESWRRFEAELGADVGLTWGGELRWAATEEGGAELRRRVAELQSWGDPVRSLAAERVRELEPGFRFGPVHAASYTDADAHVDLTRVAEACVDRVRAAGGAAFLNEPVTGLESGADGRVRAVRTAARWIACDAVVVAAGAATGRVAALANVDVPDANSHGATVVTGPLNESLFRTICAFHSPRDRDGLLLNLRQFPDGRVQIHGGTHAGSIGDRSEGDARSLIEEAAGWLPALAGAEVDEVRTAVRPVPADGLPVVGFAERAPNLYLAFTHSGATLAPLLGAWAATEIATGVRVDDLTPYRPERFAAGA